MKLACAFRHAGVPLRETVAHDHSTAAQCVGHDNCNVVGTAFTGEERHVRWLGKVDAIERDGLQANLEGS